MSEEVNFIEKLHGLSSFAELVYNGALLLKPELYDEYKADPHLFQNGEKGQFLYSLIGSMVKKHKYEVLDRLSIETFISSQSKKLQDMYVKFGGYSLVETAITATDVSNIEQYYLDLLKASSLRRLHKFGFDLSKKWDYYAKATYHELTAFIESIVSESFSESDLGGDKVVDLREGIDEMLEEIDKEKYIGLPVASKCLNAVINGLTLGNITMVAGMSGVGKTYLTINLLLPTIIKYNTPVLIMANEEDANKWRWSILIWVVNNVITRTPEYKGQYIEKSRMFVGHFTPEEKEVLKKAKEWYEENLQKKIINFVSFNTFSTDKAIRLVRKYATQENIKYFILDTFKLDNTSGSSVNDVSWLQLQQNIVKLYNVIKESSKNVHVWITYQLTKQRATRYLDQSSLGMSKNVADVVSTLILARKVFENEKNGDNKAHSIKIKDREGNEKLLDPGNEYMVLFIDKNRSGPTSKQIILKTDKGKNIMRDVGYTQISEDF